MDPERSAIEIIPAKLYFACVDEQHIPLESNDSRHCFSVEKQMRYQAFFADFGPLHLGHVFRFCVLLEELMQRYHDQNTRIIFYCSKHPHVRTNCAIIVLRRSVPEAYAPFIGTNRTSSLRIAHYKHLLGIEPPFFPYRDAGFALCTFPMTVIDCARAMHKAVSLGHFDMRSFNIAEFEHLQKLQHGDISWIIPNKFIAFSGPQARKIEIEPGVFTMNAAEYVPLFRRLGVTCVIRFNKKCYDKQLFTEAGIRHVDLYYEDGSNPSDDILNSFLAICEETPGVIAVHCKAGLGRTGTNIVAYIMKHYGYSAREGIAWCRICRPGSVVGPQQQFLVVSIGATLADASIYVVLQSIEGRMKQEGALFREGRKSTNRPSQFTPATAAGQELVLSRVSRNARSFYAPESPVRPSTIRGTSARSVRRIKQPERHSIPATATHHKSLVTASKTK